MYIGKKEQNIEIQINAEHCSLASSKPKGQCINKQAASKTKRVRRNG